MMHNWKEILIPAFEVRKKRAQKTAFIEYLRSVYGDRMRVEECGTIVKSRNIVLGDPERADVIYTAHYDTCAKLPFPNFITPCSIPLFLLYQIAVSLLLVIPIFGLSVLAAWLTRGLPGFVSLIVTEAVLFLALFGVLWLFMGGVPNPHTANDNTSGIVTVLSLADRLLDREGVRAAFILFDNEENGLLGSMGYAAAHREIRKSTLLVNFDCVSDGDHLAIFFSKAAQVTPLWQDLSLRAPRLAGTSGKTALVTGIRGNVYPSDQANFKKSVAVCALNQTRGGTLYMNRIHTAKDTVFDEWNIRLLLALFAPDADFTDKPAQNTSEEGIGA